MGNSMSVSEDTVCLCIWAVGVPCLPETRWASCWAVFTIYRGVGSGSAVAKPSAVWVMSTSFPAPARGLPRAGDCSICIKATVPSPPKIKFTRDHLCLNREEQWLLLTATCQAALWTCVRFIALICEQTLCTSDSSIYVPFAQWWSMRQHNTSISILLMDR